MKKLLLTVLAFLISEVCLSQMINSGTQMSIAIGTTMSVDTDFLNTGTLINQGDILLTGDWLNVGIYDSTGGQLIFNSPDVQEIMNNGQEINNLVIQNGVKTLNDDLKITGELSLNSGILKITGEANLTLGQGVLITGASEDAYVDGKLIRVGTGDLFYPIGSSAEYLPVILKEVTGQNPAIGMRAYSDKPTQSLSDNIQELAKEAYWEMSTNETYTSGQIQIPFDETNDPSKLVVAQATSEGDVFNTIGNEGIGHAEGINYITSAGNAIGPFFTLAIEPESAPLPPLKVVNVLTPLQDGKHDYLRIENIELYPDNKVEIFDRHGNKVFSLADYNNRDRVFRGTPNSGISGQLPDGNYFYTIKTGKTKVTSGFLFLKR